MNKLQMYLNKNIFKKHTIVVNYHLVTLLMKL